MHEKDSHTNCILLRDVAADDDHALHDALRDRHWHVESTSSPHQAFARLCLHERLESSRASWGLERHTPPVLVIDAHHTSALHDQLLAACDTYLGGIGIWQWRDGRLLELRAAAPPPQPHQPSQQHHNQNPSAHNAPPAHPETRSNNGPMLRLHEPPDDAPRTGQQHDTDDASEQEQHDSRAASLSTDEVNMLLGSGEEPSSP